MNILYYTGIRCGRLLQILAIFLIFFVSSFEVSANAPIDKGGVFFIKLSDDGGTLPFLQVDETMEITFSDGIALNFMEMDEEAAFAEILRHTSETYDVETINYIGPKDIINIAILGDIQNPGKYPFPIDSLLPSLNSYHAFFDDTDVEADFTLIRNSQHIKVPAGKSAEWQLEAGDAVLISLREKVLEKTVDSQDHEGSDKGMSKQPDLEKNLDSEVRERTQSNIFEKTLPEVSDTLIFSDILSTGIENPEDYHLQPGDVLIVRLPEESGFDQDFLINHNGDILLPEVGEINVQGNDIITAKKLIKDKLSNYFLGLDSVDIYLKERKLLITVLGYVESPGEVVLPSTGNIQMAINEAGGFREGALLNKIKLKRESSAQVIDFRKYLNSGDDRYLPALQSLDTIFVPSSPELGNIYGQSAEKVAIDPTQDRDAIKVIGEVIKPGSLAFKENMTAVDALLLAGGVTRYADEEKIRVINDGKPTSFSLADFMEFGQISDEHLLSKGATIYVPIKDESAAVADDPTDNPESIKVFGEVGRPGVHKYKENISLVDIILLSGGVTRYANVEQIRLISQGEPTLFNLKAYLDNGTRLPVIEPGSTVFVPKQVDAISSGESVVYIMGQVHKPGAFETGNDVSFMDVLANAGGPTRYADTSSIRVLRKTGQVVKFNLDEYSEGRVQELPSVFKGDSILVPKKAGEDQGWLKFKSDQTVKIIGAINKPGRYPWSANIDFLDLFAYAGGGNENADIAHIKFIYPEISGENKVTNFNLQGFMDNGSQASELPELVGGLTIVVPELPKSPTDNKSRWVLLAKEQAIYILGSVNKPGRYAFNERLDLLDILTAADGPTPDADLSNIRVVHRSEGEGRLSSVNLIKYFATGDETLLPKIKPGDGIYINSRDASMMGKDETITVLGDVNTTGRFIYRSELTIVDLISEAGGTKADADIENVIIKRGEEQIEFDLEGYMNSPSNTEMPELRPGDTVYIGNDSKDFLNVSREWIKDIASVVPLILLIMGL